MPSDEGLHLDAARVTASSGPVALRLGPPQLGDYLSDRVTDYAIFALSPEGVVETWNTGAERAFGYSKDEILGRPFSVIFTPEDIEAGAPGWELRTARAQGKIDCDRWHVRKDGSHFWGTNTVERLSDEIGDLTGFSKIVRDSTDRYLAVAALRESEERMRILLESIQDYAIFSLSSEGVIQTWNAGAKRLFGFREHEVVGKYFAMLYTNHDAALGVPENELQQAEALGTSVDERWHLRKDGSRFFAAGKLSRVGVPEKGGPHRGFVKIAHDITVRKEMEDAMRHEAFHDALTGLPNRSLFLEHLRRSIAQAFRNPDRSYTVFFMDLDRFKLLNDSVGHILADRVLIAFANRVARFVRAEDVVARLGGDEFAVLVSEVASKRDAVALAKRLHAALSEAFVIENRELYLTSSIGIAFGVTNYDEPEQVLRDADIAMYAAKTQGRGKSVLFDAAMYRDIVARNDLEGELRRAVRNKEFRIMYQPILDLETSRVVGFEALVRWQHPSRGLLSPAHFLEAAEDSKVIIDIDRWVLREACSDVAAWQAGHVLLEPLTLSINLSSRQFSDPSLAEQIRAVLEETGFAPQSLKLEITENALMENSDNVKANLLELRELGIELHVDDFGTGYSSLTYLRDLPVSALKIDRSFIRGMLSDAGSGEIVRSVVTLAHNFDLKAIAEGVENFEQMTALRALACEYGQGFLFSEPLVWDAARALLEGPGALSF